MIKFPASIREKVFRSSLKQGTIFRLKGDEPFYSEEYHIFVVLNFDPQSGEILILANGTSQVQKRCEFLDKLGIDVNATTVKIPQGKYKFTTKDTLFDCNTIHRMNINSINFANGMAKEITCDELSNEDIEKLISATLASPLVPEHNKGLIRPKK